MSHIIETIIIGKLAYKFIFHKVVTTAAFKFFVSVQRDEKQVATFEIKKVNDKWELLQPVKPAILEKEKTLIDIVEKRVRLKGVAH